MKKNFGFRIMAYVLVPAILLTANAVADEITDTIDEAVASYKEGKYSKAAEDLSFAMDLIRQKKGTALQSYLPDALPGWKAEEPTSQTVGAAMFGGGTTLSREYSKGDSKVTIEMVTDSPMMQGIAMMLSNPMFAGSDGGKLTRVNREKAIVKYDGKERSGEIIMIADNRFLITVKGNNVSKEDLMAYAKAIDIKKLKEAA